MAQFARPSVDVTLNAWTTQSGATTNLWSAIDEVDASETDYVSQASPGSNNNLYEVRLAAVTTPLIKRYHAVRYRYRKSQALGNVRNLTVGLYQGTTLIAANAVHNDITVAWTEGAFLLTVAQANAITDYTNLRLRFTPSGVTSGSTARRMVQVSWAQLRVPDWQPTFENEWGATEDTSTPGVTRYILNGITGEGARREDALVDLWQKHRDIDPFNAVYERRWKMAYYTRKNVDYTTIRSQIQAGTYTLPAHQTQADGLAICDEKLARFITITTQADLEDRA
jgi:hypothetical protein